MTDIARPSPSVETAPSHSAFSAGAEASGRAAAAKGVSLREFRLPRSGRRPIGFVGAVAAAMRTAPREAGQAGRNRCGHEAALYMTANGGLVASLAAWADPVRFDLSEAPLDVETGAPLRMRWSGAALIGSADDARALIESYDPSSCLPAPIAEIGFAPAPSATAEEDVAEAAAVAAAVQAWERYGAACRTLETDFDGLVARFFGRGFIPARRRTA